MYASIERLVILFAQAQAGHEPYKFFIIILIEPANKYLFPIDREEDFIMINFQTYFIFLAKLYGSRL